LKKAGAGEGKNHSVLIDVLEAQTIFTAPGKWRDTGARYIQETNGRTIRVAASLLKRKEFKLWI